MSNNPGPAAYTPRVGDVVTLSDDSPDMVARLIVATTPLEWTYIGALDERFQPSERQARSIRYFRHATPEELRAAGLPVETVATTERDAALERYMAGLDGGESCKFWNRYAFVKGWDAADARVVALEAQVALLTKERNAARNLRSIAESALDTAIKRAEAAERARDEAVRLAERTELESARVAWKARTYDRVCERLGCAGDLEGWATRMLAQKAKPTHAIAGAPTLDALRAAVVDTIAEWFVKDGDDNAEREARNVACRNLIAARAKGGVA